MSKAAPYQLLRTKSGQAAPPAPWDVNLVLPVLLLTVIGIIMVFSASYPLVLKVGHHHAYYYAERQALFALLGLGALFASSRIKLRIIYQWAYVILVGALGLLAVVLVIGRDINGARSWIALGPFNFQPSELAKIALLLALARFFSDYPQAVGSLKGLLPPLAMTGGVCLLVLAEKDFGIAAIIGLAAMSLFFLAGARLKHLAGLLVAAGLAGIALIIHEPYRMARIFSFLNPEAHADAGGYQIMRALIALGSGGLMGRGFAASREKYFYLPNPETDSIFAVIGEELGLVFCLFILGLFCWLAWRGMKIASSCGDKFSSLAAAGLTNLIILQAAINLLVILDLLPNTGLPLPFISYGGSALVFNLIAVGLIANISRQCAFADEGAGVGSKAPPGESEAVAATPGRTRAGGRALRPRGF
jgi:cell division protein FtsW